MLDTAFTGLIRGADGRARVVLRDPDGGRSITLWVDEAFDYLMVYTGDTVEPASRRRQGVAIEPMTCPPDALRSGDHVIGIAPGGSWRGAWGIACDLVPRSGRRAVG